MTEVNGAYVPTKDELKALVRKAEQGDPTVLPTLRTWMDRTPGHWEAGGDLAKTARECLIRTISDDENLLVQEVYARTCAALTTELAGPAPSPLERLLVERIVFCWLQLYYAEALYAQNLQERLSIRQDELYQQRISKAHARYLSAIRTLAQVRRLGVPAVQVNIGQQQVIAGS